MYKCTEEIYIIVRYVSALLNDEASMSVRAGRRISDDGVVSCVLCQRKLYFETSSWHGWEGPSPVTASKCKPLLQVGLLSSSSQTPMLLLIFGMQ